MRDGVSADRVNLCGGALAAVPQNRFGLVLDAHFPAEAPATGAPVTGSVTLTNTSARTITGTSTSRPTRDPLPGRRCAVAQQRRPAGRHRA